MNLIFEKSDCDFSIKLNGICHALLVYYYIFKTFRSIFKFNLKFAEFVESIYFYFKNLYKIIEASLNQKRKLAKTVQVSIFL